MRGHTRRNFPRVFRAPVWPHHYRGRRARAVLYGGIMKIDGRFAFGIRPEVHSEGDALFWARVKKKSIGGCWEWMGSRTPAGYGNTSCGGIRKYSHRASWEKKYGDIPRGMFVCHRCDNPPCVNPKHLYIGTSMDNSRDMVSRLRCKNQNTGKEECMRGHRFSASNTYRYRGNRACKKCAIWRQRKRRSISGGVENNGV